MKVLQGRFVFVVLGLALLLAVGFCIYEMRDKRAAIDRGSYVRIEPYFTHDGEVRATFYAPEVLGMVVDRRAGWVNFELEGGMEVQAMLGDSIWSEGCPTMLNVTLMEVLWLQTEPLQLGELKMAEPVLVSTCGPGQQWVVTLMDLQPSCPWWEEGQVCAQGCAWWEDEQVCLWFGQERVELRVNVSDSATKEAIPGAVVVLQRGASEQTFIAPTQIALTYREVVRLEAQAPGYMSRSLELATAEKYFEVFTPEGNPLTWTNWKDGNNALTFELIRLP